MNNSLFFTMFSKSSELQTHNCYAIDLMITIVDLRTRNFLFETIVRKEAIALHEQMLFSQIIIYTPFTLTCNRGGGYWNQLCVCQSVKASLLCYSDLHAQILKSFGTNVHHNKKKCRAHDLCIYVEGQGH